MCLQAVARGRPEGERPHRRSAVSRRHKERPECTSSTVLCLLTFLCLYWSQSELFWFDASSTESLSAGSNLRNVSLLPRWTPKIMWWGDVTNCSGALMKTGCFRLYFCRSTNRSTIWSTLYTEVMLRSSSCSFLYSENIPVLHLHHDSLSFSWCLLLTLRKCPLVFLLYPVCTHPI